MTSRISWLFHGSMGTVALISINSTIEEGSNKSDYLHQMGVNSVISMLRFCAHPVVESHKIPIRKTLVTFKREFLQLCPTDSLAPQEVAGKEWREREAVRAGPQAGLWRTRAVLLFKKTTLLRYTWHIKNWTYLNYTTWKVWRSVNTMKPLPQSRP